jgi:hypothetical protein
MIRTLVGLLPMAIAVAVVGTVIWLLVTRNVAFGRWLLAAFLIGHGLVHVMFVAPRPAEAEASAGGVPYPFDLTRSWLLSGADPALLRTIGTVLVAAIVVAFVMAGLASVGWLLPLATWSWLVVVGSLASLLMLGLFFQPGLLVGLTITVALLVAGASSWRPDVTVIQAGPT